MGEGGRIDGGEDGHSGRQGGGENDEMVRWGLSPMLEEVLCPPERSRLVGNQREDFFSNRA